ncbi:hypothetical protein FQZ97_946110 [compost metagenome]
MHQAQAQGLQPVEAGGGEGQAAGLGQADALDHEGGDLRRQDAEAGFRQAELRALQGDGDIRNAGQAEAAAEHRAFQHGDQHLGLRLGFFQQAAKGTVQPLVGLATGGAGAGHVLDVAAGAEVPAGTAQHQGAHAGVAAHGGQHRAQLVHHGQAHGVAAVGPVQGDVQHAAGLFQQQGFAVRQFGHAGVLIIWIVTLARNRRMG